MTFANIKNGSYFLAKTLSVLPRIGGVSSQHSSSAKSGIRFHFGSKTSYNASGVSARITSKVASNFPSLKSSYIAKEAAISSSRY